MCTCACYECVHDFAPLSWKCCSWYRCSFSHFIVLISSPDYISSSFLQSTCAECLQGRRHGNGRNTEAHERRLLPSTHSVRSVGLWGGLIYWLIRRLFFLSLGFASPLGYDCSVDLHTRNAPRPTTWQMNGAWLTQWSVIFLQTWDLRKGHLPKIPERGVQDYFITTSIELFKLWYKYSATQIFLWFPLNGKSFWNKNNLTSSALLFLRSAARCIYVHKERLGLDTSGQASCILGDTHYGL